MGHERCLVRIKARSPTAAERSSQPELHRAYKIHMKKERPQWGALSKIV